MATAAEYLRDWVESYVLSELRTQEEVADLVAECIEDAAADGISEGELQMAAGGNLVRYMRNAIRYRDEQM